MKKLAIHCLYAVSALFALGISGCAALGGGSASGSGGYEAFSSGRCGACGGSGQTMDHNRGVYETCHYCGGRGSY